MSISLIARAAVRAAFLASDAEGRHGAYAARSQGALCEVDLHRGRLRRDGPPRDGPPRDGPPRDGPPRDGPPRDGPPRDGPPRDGPPRDGPPSRGVQDGRCLSSMSDPLVCRRLLVVASSWIRSAGRQQLSRVSHACSRASGDPYPWLAHVRLQSSTRFLRLSCGRVQRLTVPPAKAVDKPVAAGCQGVIAVLVADCRSRVCSRWSAPTPAGGCQLSSVLRTGRPAVRGKAPCRWGLAPLSLTQRIISQVGRCGAVACREESQRRPLLPASRLCSHGIRQVRRLGQSTPARIHLFSFSLSVAPQLHCGRFVHLQPPTRCGAPCWWSESNQIAV
jgi:hypothetical protein